MSLTELFIILFISLGIVDKKRTKKIMDIFQNYNEGPTRKVIGDSSLNQKWQWIENEEE
tara:strand:- start:169 stop:345 length:177 start_codon:yes stop_codon:yes gene_type:complete